MEVVRDVWEAFSKRSWTMLGAGWFLAWVWMGVVFLCVNAFLNRNAQRDFCREGRRYIELWADRTAELFDHPDRQEVLIRRLSAEPDSRTAGTLDREGRWIVRVGPWVEIPSFSSSSKINDKRLNPDAWLFRAPMWVEGRRASDLVWVRDCREMESEARRRRRGLILAWGWWAVAGAVGLMAWAGQNGVLGVDNRDDPIDPTPS